MSEGRQGLLSTAGYEGERRWGLQRTTLRAHTLFLTRGPDCLLTSHSADISNSSSSLILFSLSGSSWHGCEEEKPGGRGGKRDGHNSLPTIYVRSLCGPEFHQAKALQISNSNFKFCNLFIS